jgi:hypothetical protein
MLHRFLPATVASLRTVPAALVLLLAACATEHSGVPAADAAASSATTVSSAPGHDPQLAQIARSAGYEIRTESGETLYCRRDFVTGSHLRKETTCLTAAELRELEEATGRALREMSRHAPPPHGT